MDEHQQLGVAPPNIPPVPPTSTSSQSFLPALLKTPPTCSTSTSPQSFPPAPLNTPPTFSTSISPPSSNRGQGEHFATLHAIIISLITSVGGYVLFQFQTMKLSLFDEHGNIMRASFVMLFFYVVAFMAEFRLQNESNYFAIMRQFTPLFGLLVVVLLLFILSLFLGLAASIIWAFLVVGPTLRLFQTIIQWLNDKILFIFISQTTAASNPDVEEIDSIGIQENGLPV